MFAQQAHALAFALVLVVIVGVVGGSIGPTSLTPAGVASAIGSGALYYAGAYWFYLGALRNVPASLRGRLVLPDPDRRRRRRARCSSGERLDPQQWVGALLVIGAVVAIARQQVCQLTDGGPGAAGRLT